jgi:hypothetical protein
MKLRGYFGVSLMIGLTAWVPFLIIIGLIWIYVEGFTIKQALLNSLMPSLYLGLIYGFSMGWFYRVDTVKVKPADGANVLEKLVLEMSYLGYHPDNQVENVFTFTPNIYAGKAAGNISAILKDKELVLTGPRYHIRSIRRRMR